MVSKILEIIQRQSADDHGLQLKLDLTLGVNPYPNNPDIVCLHMYLNTCRHIHVYIHVYIHLTMLYGCMHACYVECIVIQHTNVHVFMLPSELSYDRLRIANVMLHTQSRTRSLLFLTRYTHISNPVHVSLYARSRRVLNTTTNPPTPKIRVGGDDNNTSNRRLEHLSKTEDHQHRTCTHTHGLSATILPNPPPPLQHLNRPF